MPFLATIRSSFIDIYDIKWIFRNTAFIYFISFVIHCLKLGNTDTDIILSFSSFLILVALCVKLKYQLEPERSATLSRLSGFVGAYLLAAWHLHSTVDGFFAGAASNISVWVGWVGRMGGVEGGWCENVRGVWGGIACRIVLR